MNEMQILQEQALRIREHILTITAGQEGAHLGGSLSAVDVLTVLYFYALRLHPEEPQWAERDYFVLSKGHASAALYATLAERGFFPVGELATYARSSGRLMGHPTRKVPGVEFPTGSLGHGLSLGVGLTLAAQRDGRANRVFVMLGDGELQEGSVWEAAMSASHFGLDNLVAIVDRNRLQINGSTEQGMRLEPLGNRWQSFGWSVTHVNGHDIGALVEAFDRLPFETGRPSVLIANTVKGQGVKFLEGRKKSHYAILKPQLYEQAWNELHNGKKGER